VLRQQVTGTTASQQDLAKVAMREDFLKVFRIYNGSIRVREDMVSDMSKYGCDSCAQTAAKDFLADSKPGGLQPSMAHNMATTLAVQGAFFDVVTNYINDPKADPAETAKKLGAAIKSAK
ncbi:sugar ABC transporter substrate-binding protein, partial [Pseudomonas syringae]